jgi:hypothetical protein
MTIARGFFESYFWEAVDSEIRQMGLSLINDPISRAAMAAS